MSDVGTLGDDQDSNDESVVVSDESAFTSLMTSGSPNQVEDMLTKLYSEDKRAVVLKATLGSQPVTGNQLQVATFVIDHFREFLNENPEDVLDFIVRYISCFSEVLFDFILDKVAKAERFEDLRKMRLKSQNQNIRHKARDLLDSNVGKITDPDVLSTIGAFGLNKASRRSAIERLAQSQGNASFLSFIMVSSSNSSMSEYYDDGIAELARRGLQNRSS